MKLISIENKHWMNRVCPAVFPSGHAVTKPNSILKCSMCPKWRGPCPVLKLRGLQQKSFYCTGSPHLECFFEDWRYRKKAMGSLYDRYSWSFFKHFFLKCQLMFCNTNRSLFSYEVPQYKETTPTPSSFLLSVHQSISYSRRIQSDMKLLICVHEQLPTALRHH